MSTIARPLAEWHEDDGPALWWRFPIMEPLYVGTPLDCPTRVEIAIDGWVTDTRKFGGWPGYHTHWTPLPPLPDEPAARANQSTPDMIHRAEAAGIRVAQVGGEST